MADFDELGNSQGQVGEHLMSEAAPTPAAASAGNSAPAQPAPTTAAPAPSAAPQQQSTQNAPQAPAISPGAANEMAHENVLGKAVRALMGTPVDYKVNPQTGQTEAVPVPQKPGDLFRHILGAAILGQAMSSHSRNFGEGFAAGAGGAIQRNDSLDKERFDRAQTGFKNSLEARKMTLEEDRLNQEKIYQQAQIAHMHTADVHADSNMDLMRQEHIDRLNQYNDTLREATVKAGGTPAPIYVDGKNINGQAGNGKALMQQYTKDASSLAAPQGYHRVHMQNVDYSGLTYKAGIGWTNEKGDLVDLSSRTTHTLYDVPQNVWNERVEVSGKELNTLAGFKAFKDDETKSVSYGDLVSLKTQGTKNEHENLQVQLEKQRVGLEARRLTMEADRIKKEADRGNRQDLMGEEKALRDDLNSLMTQWKTDKGNFDDAGAKDVENQIKGVRQRLEDIDQKLFPQVGPPAPAATGTPAQASSEAPKSRVDNAIGYMVENHIPAATEETYSYIQGLKDLSADEKMDLARRMKAVVPYDEVARISDEKHVPFKDIKAQMEKEGLTVGKNNEATTFMHN